MCLLNTIFNMTEEKKYHHGNLAESLVDGFIELLTSTPVEKLSLRRLAAHIGVANTAVYNHFSSKEELLVAVKLRCLNHFANFLESSVDPSDSVEEKIKNLGRGYYIYSIKYSQYFSFIMSDNLSEDLITQELIETSMRAEQALRSAVIELLQENNLPETKYNEGLGAFVCWSITHGISALAAKNVNHAACLTGRWPEEFMLCDSEQIEKSYDAVCDVIILGLIEKIKRLS